MKVKINGQQEVVNNGVFLHELILSKGLCPERIVVEHNFSILSKEKWPEIILEENDNVEIISFLGGG